VHENVTTLNADQEREVTQKAMDFWKNFMGKIPVGVRTGAWDFTDSTALILKEFGVIYDSSLMADDRPYMILVDGKETGIIELPVEWINDDWPLFQINWAGHHVAARNGDDVFKVWAGQFDKAYEERTMFILTMHPQVIGHGYRIIMLEKLIQYMKSKPGVWFGTHEEIARYALEHGGK
jgi:peptidoglycan/xylan/chitin deacetylase (PgdA/CDA1 family)